MLSALIISHCPAMVTPEASEHEKQAALGKLFGWLPRMFGMGAKAAPKVSGIPSFVGGARSVVPSVGAKVPGFWTRPRSTAPLWKVGLPAMLGFGAGNWTGGQAGYGIGHQVGELEGTGKTLQEVGDYGQDFLSNNRWKTLGASLANLFGVQPSQDTKSQMLQDFIGSIHGPRQDTYRTLLPHMQAAMASPPAAKAAPAAQPPPTQPPTGPAKPAPAPNVAPPVPVGPPPMGGAVGALDPKLSNPLK